MWINVQNTINILDENEGCCKYSNSVSPLYDSSMWGKYETVLSLSTICG